MKLSTKLFVYLFTWLLVLFAGLSTALATDVGGIINTATTWTLDNSPYNITSTVQIPEGVTLTIQPGVVVNNGRIEIWGAMNAIGKSSSKIYLNNVVLYNKSWCSLYVSYADIYGGGFESELLDGYGLFSLKNCNIDSISGLQIMPSTVYGKYQIIDNVFQNSGTFPDSVNGPVFIDIADVKECRIERNVFIGCGSTSVDGDRFVITNNAFLQQVGYYTISCNGLDDTDRVMRYNSFLSTDRIAIKDIPLAKDNYWNTTDTTVIESMIYDRSDDLSCTYSTSYTPFLTEPHPDTPALEDITPISNGLIYSHSYYLPYFKDASNYWTGLGLRNLSADSNANIEAVIYDENGTIQITEEANIPKRGQDSFVTGKEMPDEGWIKINSTQSLGGLCFVGTKGADNYMADVPFTSESSDSLIIPHVAQGPQWDTCVMVCNPNKTQTTVTLTFVDQNGNVLFTAIKTVAANGSFKYDLSEMVSSSEISYGGSVEISATQGVVAFGLYNNLKNGGYCYSGINAIVF